MVVGFSTSVRHKLLQHKEKNDPAQCQYEHNLLTLFFWLLGLAG